MEYENVKIESRNCIGQCIAMYRVSKKKIFNVDIIIGLPGYINFVFSCGPM